MAKLLELLDDERNVIKIHIAAMRSFCKRLSRTAHIRIISILMHRLEKGKTLYMEKYRL